MSIKNWTTRKNYTPFVVLYMSLQTDSQPLPLSVVRSRWFSGGQSMPSGSRATPLLRYVANRRPRGATIKPLIKGKPTMFDLKYNAELPGEAAARRARADAAADGSRSQIDNLTDAERQLLINLRRQGYEVAQVGEYARFVRRLDAVAA